MLYWELANGWVDIIAGGGRGPRCLSRNACRKPIGDDFPTQRAGSVDLPLRDGRVPKWLGGRMTRVGAVITEAIVQQYGREEILRRLACPFWFQSFGAVMGMDWHSSGITTAWSCGLLGMTSPRALRDRSSQRLGSRSRLIIIGMDGTSEAARR